VYYEEEEYVYMPRIPQLSPKQKKKAFKALSKSIKRAQSLIDISFGKWFYLSIRHKRSCLFSRRNVKIGNIIFNHSVIIRIFNRDII
jgi:hypothetical protein